MSEEEKKKSFRDPNGLYKMKNRIGVLSVTIGIIIGVIVWVHILFLLLHAIYYGENAKYEAIGGYISTWKIDTGIAILLGSTIISGAILLSGIRKEKDE